MNDLTPMIDAANAVMQKAYAPYSKFKVGACVKTQDGQLFSGCNIENSVYPLTLCAEAVAISSMISTIGTAKITDAVICSSGAIPCPPCGACRQRFKEFASTDLTIHLCESNNTLIHYSLDQLLPHAFGPTYLETNN